MHAEHQQVDTAIEQHQVEHTDHRRLQPVQATYYSLGSEVAASNRPSKAPAGARPPVARRPGRLPPGSPRPRPTWATTVQNWCSWESELATLAPEMALLQELEESSGEARCWPKRRCIDWQQRWDEFNQHAAEPRQQAEVQQSRIRHLEQVLQRIQGPHPPVGGRKSRAWRRAPGHRKSRPLGEQLAELELIMAAITRAAANRW